MAATDPHRLEVLAWSMTGRQEGGGPVSWLSSHLSAFGAGFGPSVSEIHLGLYYKWNDITKDEISRGFANADVEHNAFCEKLPRRRFKRQKRILQIDWYTEDPRAVAEKSFSKLTIEDFERTFDHLIDAVSCGTELLRPTDKFDGVALLNWLRSVRAEDRGDQVTLRRRLKADEAICQTRWSAIDPWDKLDRDWDAYHPDARIYLDDPSDWTHSFAPHGSDTGALIIEKWDDFQHLDARQARALLYDDDKVKTAPKTQDEIAWREWVEINLALVFGHVVMTGTYPISLLQDMSDGFEVEIPRAERNQASSEHGEEYLRRLKRYREILARCSTIGS